MVPETYSFHSATNRVDTDKHLRHVMCLHWSRAGRKGARPSGWWHILYYKFKVSLGHSAFKTSYTARLYREWVEGERLNDLELFPTFKFSSLLLASIRDII